MAVGYTDYQCFVHIGEINKPRARVFAAEALHLPRAALLPLKLLPLSIISTMGSRQTVQVDSESESAVLLVPNGRRSNWGPRLDHTIWSSRSAWKLDERVGGKINH
ncbi:unnamed protein product [Clonostachys chloroleuca]|uniref:Uncharacterized protein n=1 Tax=Clonostachys chloroleuca TaxID=1926264 RepID=A0AA35MIY4_9HYPO|nr:unnamed protein product [Clonostachys chloroleuca]